eukprot:1161639-Pelagomonas_calceolata.AAC.14
MHALPCTPPQGYMYACISNHIVRMCKTCVPCKALLQCPHLQGFRIILAVRKYGKPGMPTNMQAWTRKQVIPKTEIKEKKSCTGRKNDVETCIAKQ